jgi:hypothetical protein
MERERLESILPHPTKRSDEMEGEMDAHLKEFRHFKQ